MVYGLGLISTANMASISSAFVMVFWFLMTSSGSPGRLNFNLHGGCTLEAVRRVDHEHPACQHVPGLYASTKP